VVSHVQPSEDILSCEMQHFHSGVDGDACLPGCDAVLLGECLNCSPFETVSHPGRLESDVQVTVHHDKFL